MSETSRLVGERERVRAREVRVARDREIVALRAQGFSLAEIGGWFGLSRQHVDRITRRGGGGVDGAVALSRARRAERFAERRELGAGRARERSVELLERYRAGQDMLVVARELGLSQRAVQGVVVGVRTGADQAARRGALSRAAPRYSDAELVDGIRRLAGRVGGVPTSEQYERLGAEMGLMSMATLRLRLGSWNQALRVAGFDPRPGRARGSRWDEQACWRALESVADRLGDPPRYERYEQIASGREDLPSGALLRQRLGRWSQIAAALTAEGDWAADRREAA